MRTFEFITAALIGSASAIKMGQDDKVYTTTQRDGNMSQTLTTESFTLANLDDVQDEIKGWYDKTASPFIVKHREQVYKAALAETEKIEGQLLETCDEGTACREQVEKEMKEKITEIWKQVLKEFNDSITASIVTTRDQVDGAWSSLVQCGLDANCCKYTEITISNLWIQVNHYRTSITTESQKWLEFEERRIAITEECPEENLVCGNVCFDGSARFADSCTCPILAFPACPTSACSDDTARDAETCGCPNDVSQI